MPLPPEDRGRRRGVRVGRYEVVAHIATGGMGAVYRAVDTATGREVALKVLAPELAARPVLLQRFRQEARSAARLSHENIVALYECGEANGTNFLALEFVDGVDLHDHVSRRRRLDPPEAREILVQAARALDHAHRQGIVHRDIKPSNFLLTRRGGRLLVKLTDLGLARPLDEDQYRFTRVGTTVGTLDYMAPEQARDSRAADVRSDIYSLGCTLYFMLAGRPPFHAGSIAERLFAHAETAPRDIREINPAVPDDLAAVLRRMLAKKQADRFQSPADLLAALGSPAVPSLPVEAGPAPAPPPPPGGGTIPPPPEPPPWPGQPAGGKAPSGETRPPPRRSSGALPARGRPPEAAEREGRKKRNRKARAARGLPRSWRWAAAGVGVAAALLLGVVLLGGGGEEPAHPEGAGPAPGKPARPSAAETPGVAEAGTTRPADKAAPKAGGGTGLATIYSYRFGPAPEKVRRDYEGPPADWAAPPQGAPVLRVSRLPGAGGFASLADALAQVPPGGAAVVEIHDNGPLFEPAVPDLGGRRVVLRPGRGYRPLLAWDVGGAGPAPGRFFALDGGSLVLQDLDVVVKWNEPRADRPAALFHVKGGDLAADGCTFSVAGSHPRGTVLAWLEGGAPCRCRLSRCHVRGSLAALHLHGPAADVLVEDCLAAGRGQPLVEVVTGEAGAPTLRLVRSTLVCDGTFLLARPESGPQRKAALDVLCCDSLLAQNDPRADGVLLRLGEGLAPDRVGWKAVNTVYAGWRDLLASPDRTIPAAAFESGWWRLWGRAEGDKAVPGPWPPTPLSEPEDTAAAAYDPAGTAAHFAALTRPGPLGCDVAALPRGRPQWAGLTFDRFSVELPPLPAGDAPPVPSAADGLYHGEHLTLTKDFDLGRHLAARLAERRPAPVVVLHLSGRDEVPTSPVRLQGASLVLAFEGPGARGDPLALVPAGGGADALIEVAGGDLELVKARVTFPASRPAPRGVVKVQGGRLRLFGCHLRGPLAAAEGGYQGLLDLAGPAPACAINQSVLLSAGSVLHVRGGGARLRLRRSLALATDDLLVLDLGGADRCDVHAALENNTLAVRRSLVDVRGTPATGAAPAPAVFRADGNLFLAPFEGPGPSTLLRCDRDLLARGLLLWQGLGNGFDRRLHGYLTAAGEPPAGPQPFAAWVRAWGTPGERAPLLVDMPRVPFKLSPLRLRLLALPRESYAEAGAERPGADLALLGIVAARK